jgi:hypothetical protein
LVRVRSRLGAVVKVIPMLGEVVVVVVVVVVALVVLVAL